jgi:hypothetical protein
MRTVADTLSSHPEERPESASRRMLQMVPEPPGASFETPLSRLLRMRAVGSRRWSLPNDGRFARLA